MEKHHIDHRLIQNIYSFQIKKRRRIIKKKQTKWFTLLPENPMNSSNRMTRAGNKDTIKLNVPTPIRTPLSKWVFELFLSH